MRRCWPSLLDSGTPLLTVRHFGSASHYSPPCLSESWCSFRLTTYFHSVTSRPSSANSHSKWQEGLRPVSAYSFSFASFGSVIVRGVPLVPDSATRISRELGIDQVLQAKPMFMKWLKSELDRLSKPRLLGGGSLPEDVYIPDPASKAREKRRRERSEAMRHFIRGDWEQGVR